MTNDESTYFLNSSDIILDPQNNTIKINNAFHPDGSAPDMLDVTIPNSTKGTTINILKYNDRLTTSKGNMIYKLKNKREYIRFKNLLSPIMTPGAMAQTAYRHDNSFINEMENLLKEITEEKNPGLGVKLEIVDDGATSAYGFVPQGNKKIVINARRADPELKHLVIKTMYHENEHITQFNGPNSGDYSRWEPLSTSNKSFYFSPSNPVEEGARVAGNTFGRFNFRFAAEAMRDVDINDWQDVDRNFMGILHNFTKANFGTANLDDTTMKILWGHTPAKETYPGRKTQRVLRDYIESAAIKNLPQKYQTPEVLQDVSYNILNTYIRQANAFNAGTGEILADMSLESWIESYSQRVQQDPRLAKKIEFNDTRIYDDRSISLKKRIQNTLGSLFGGNSPPSNSQNTMRQAVRQAPNAPDMLSKITNAMFHGGNRIKWR